MSDRQTREYMENLGVQQMPPLRSIRLKCGECMGGERGKMPKGETAKWINECGSTHCPLWAFRYGKNPWRSEPSEAKREAGRKLAEKRHGSN